MEKQAYNDYLNFYNEFSSLLKAPNNAKEMLKSLVNKGIKVIIVSNKERSLLLNEISVLYSDIKKLPKPVCLLLIGIIRILYSLLCF